MPTKKSGGELKKPASSKAKAAAKPDVEAREAAVSEVTAKKKATQAASGKTAAKPRAKGSKSDQAGETTARASSTSPTTKPSTPPRASIYANITATAQKLEAERAARAAQRASAASQTAPAPKPASATPSTKRTSPFLSAPISRTATGAAKPATGSTKPGLLQSASDEVTATAQAKSPPARAHASQPTAVQVADASPAVTLKEEAKPLARTTASSRVVRTTTPSSAQTAAVQSPPAPATSAGPAVALDSASTATVPVPGPAAVQAATATPTVPAPKAKAVPAAVPKPGAAGRQGAAEKRAAERGERIKATPAQAESPAPPAEPPKIPAGPVEIPAVISVRELAPLLSTSTGDMIKKLLSMGIFATINQSLDFETASLIAEEFNVKARPAGIAAPKAEAPRVSLRTAAEESDRAMLRPRPPVITVLGHVDHGKTSLLDAIRNSRVAAGEAGGITQHIGAYQVEKQGRQLTFLDTPGHEAFTAMRARGAQVTDVAVLVVAADDGVMPQTREAISHARAANVPIVVALNKIDRENADPNRAIRQLADAGLVVEEWGGDVPLVRVSAKKMIGIDELLDMILLVSDLAELKANPDRPGVGTVIEAQMDRSRGPVATLLVQLGSVRQGDYLVVSDIQGRIRAMFNDRGDRLGQAGPSTPVQVLGLPNVPRAGDTFQVVADERTARSIAEQKSEEALAQPSGRSAKTLSLDELYAQMESGKVHELNLVVKADVQGSIEPIRTSLDRLSTDALKVRILHEGIGSISESDVSLALASGAIVVGFNADIDPAARRLATAEGVDVRHYNVIYRLIEDVEKALSGLLEPTFREQIDGHAEVRKLFKVSKKAVAGSYITDGKAVRGSLARILRAGKVVHEGRVASLKRFTEDVREVSATYECGIMLEGFEDYATGDVIEFYHKEKVQ